METERPKSSALTMRRRGGLMPMGKSLIVISNQWCADRKHRAITIEIMITIKTMAASRGTIIWRNRARNKPAPGPKDEQDFLSLVQARQLGAEDLELTPLQLAQEAPIDRAHQFGSHHRTAIHNRQGLVRQPIEIPGTPGHAAGEFKEAGRIFE